MLRTSYTARLQFLQHRSLLTACSDSKEPTFLRKLKSEHGGSDSARHERPLARPRKAKDAEDDDEPTYVDEDSHDTITKLQYEALLRLADEVASDETHSETPNLLNDGVGCDTPAEDVMEGPLPRKEMVATVGVSAKRRIAKVVGNGEDYHDEASGKEVLATDQKAITLGKKLAKKPKKVKLSFD